MADDDDDLYQAEELLGQAMMTIDQLVAAHHGQTEMDPALKNAIYLTGKWERYCRPSCMWRHDNVCATELNTGESCDCPCKHGGRVGE